MKLNRFFALIFDISLYLLVLALFTYIIDLLLNNFLENRNINPGDLSLILFILPVYILYFVFLPLCLSGKTLGMEIFKLKIVSVDSNELNFVHLIKRNLFEIIFLFLFEMLNLYSLVIFNGLNLFIYVASFSMLLFYIFNFVKYISTNGDVSYRDIFSNTKIL